MYARLGDIYDDVGAIFALPTYRDWVAFVKSNGGQVLRWPFEDGTTTIAVIIDPFSKSQMSSGKTVVPRHGQPAAKYHIGEITSRFAVLGNPDRYTADHRYGYYLAPESVRTELRDVEPNVWERMAGNNEPSNILTAPTPEERATPDWYRDVMALLGETKWIIVGLVGLAVVSKFPRRD